MSVATELMAEKWDCGFSITTFFNSSKKLRDSDFKCKFLIFKYCQVIQLFQINLHTKIFNSQIVPVLHQLDISDILHTSLYS